MNKDIATEHATDMIAHIEMHRQEMAKEGGEAAACGEALRRLHELLEYEQAALQRHGTGTAHPANTKTITSEIERVKTMAGVTGGKSPLPKTRSQPQAGLRPDTAHNHVRDEGRRTMGRRGKS